MMEKVGGKTQFKEIWMFYVWALVTALMFLIVFIIIPILWDGKSIGNYLSRVKIVSEGSLTKSIIKREMFFGWAWIVLVIGIATIINHTMIIEVATTYSKKHVYKGWEAARVSAFSTLAGVITIIQMIFGISGLVKSNGISIHDKMAGSKVVFIKRFTEVKVEEKRKSIRPTIVKNNSVDWI